MTIKNLCKSYGDNVVLKDFSLDIKPCTITCIIGESGCGKTTLLNLIAGIIEPNSGSIDIGQSTVSYLFQEPRLLPWRTALENVAIALKGDKDKAKEALEMVNLEDSLDKYPSELSGGMKQRVAMARAFSYPSSLILMDEPFQNLDIKLKNNLLNQFLKLWEKDKNEDRKTVLWVTHDITEACLVADLVLCVSSKPMKINSAFPIELNRNQRTAENMAQLQAQIYEALVLI